MDQVNRTREKDAEKLIKARYSLHDEWPEQGTEN